MGPADPTVTGLAMGPADPCAMGPLGTRIEENQRKWDVRKMNRIGGRMGLTKSLLPAEPTRTGLAIGPDIVSLLSHRCFLNGVRQPALQQFVVKCV